MSQAWLDSLSEDWVSQPGSDVSQTQLPAPSKSSVGSNPTNARDPTSRIQHVNGVEHKQQQYARPAGSERSANALSERSSSDVNVRLSQRAASKSSREIKGSRRTRYPSQSLSASTSGSILHNTMDHKSYSASPSKNMEDMPEWKRRLVYGYLSYGESKDLFSSAATGLENIFRPPMSPNLSRIQDDEEEEVEYAPDNDMTLPSSPPPYRRAAGLRYSQPQADRLEQSADSSSLRQPLASAPKQMKFRRTEDARNYSRTDNSTVERTGASNTGTHEPADSSFTSVSAKQRLEASRKTSGQSGQSITRNEGLSPILISRHNSEDGKVSFAPIELPAQQLRKRLENLRRNQMVLGSDSDSDLDLRADGIPEGSQVFDDTDDFANKGGFLNLRRGGRSRDGSFRKRPLSPPVMVPTDTSMMLPESSIQASTPKQLPTIRTERFASGEGQASPTASRSPAVPPTPHPSPEKLSQTSPTQNGSPLKLFGPYDTFTNQTLLRRISQFEDQMAESPSRSVADDSLPLPMQENSRKSPNSSQGRPETSSIMNKFGVGDFDGYEFSEDMTFTSGEPSQFEDKENLEPEDDEPRPSDAVKFEIGRRLSADGESLLVQRRRQKSGIVASARSRRLVSRNPFDLNRQFSFDHIRKLQATPKREISEGKRPWTSPSKDPTPKRRRTLHRSDIAYGLDNQLGGVRIVQNSHYDMQSAIARRRRDISQNQPHNDTIPNIPIARHISRPRSPTPSQRLAKTRERKPLANIGFNPNKAKMAALKRGEESEIIVRDFATNGSRKTSMKTQDFFDAAEEIMAMIRNKARPKLSLDNVEESDAESAGPHHSMESGETEGSFQDSTKEPLSRPPSREGAPVSRIPTRQADPEIVNRLKKYEEVTELGDTGYSMRSAGRWNEADHTAQTFDDSLQDRFQDSELEHNESGEPEIISDLSHVRISRNPDAPEAVDNVAEFPSNGSQSSGTTTGQQSFPTTSSRGSDSRRLIGPDAVTELIGDQVGNMVFDKEKKVWVKVRTPKSASSGRNIPPSEDSEDDPFASIPDLSVDTVKETAHLGLAQGQRLQNIEENSHEGSSSKNSSRGSRVPNITEEGIDSRSNLSHAEDTFARIQQSLVDTPLEDDEEIEHEITIHEDRVQEATSSLRRRNVTIMFSSPIASVIQDTTPQVDGDTYDDESILPERSIDSIINDSYKRGRQNKPRRSMNGRLSSSRSRSRSRGPMKNLSVQGQAFVPRPVSRIDEQDEDSPAEQVSAAERHVSVIEESSLIGPEAGHEHHESLSIIVSTPAPTRTAAPSVATPLIARYVGTLSLSPLSEFTMNHGDQSCALEVSYVVGDQYLVTGDGSKKVMSKALRTLVEKITEVEPFEPDWGSMRELDIHSKQLTTLHRLDEFCTNVVTLNASNNSIGNLDGVPESVRNLRITHNQLSELTAWGHLVNLQYVDVSNNELSSLHVFKDLVHLRSLRADDNQIASLDGINLHDSLQVLRVRNNLIKHVDFEGTRLHRLTELDLEGNQIGSVRNVEQLRSLTTLNLQRNWLASFGPTATATATATSSSYGYHQSVMGCLRYLKISDNELTALDLSSYPSLRLLHADRNQLTTLTGFARCRRLDTLSLREQQQRRVSVGVGSDDDGGRGDDEYSLVAAPLDMSFLASAYEVRKLFLSGNNLSSSSSSSSSTSSPPSPPGTFSLPVDFLNLQYLELANCGLRALAPDLGQLTPNLRVLNVNFNALEDLAPLRHVPRLKRLLAAGNRLADAGGLADLLAGFPHLSRLDARDNPATLGFYPPPPSSPHAQTQTLVAPAAGGDDDDDNAHDHDQNAFVLPDVTDESGGRDRDRRFQSRLDMGSRMRRRLYEMVVLGRCRRLRTLDGLPVGGPGGPGARDAVLRRRDAVWDALVESGVVVAAAAPAPASTASTSTAVEVGDGVTGADGGDQGTGQDQGQGQGQGQGRQPEKQER